METSLDHVTVMFQNSVFANVRPRGSILKIFFHTAGSISFFRRVCSLMCRQGTRLWKSFSTLLAATGTFSRVCSQMCGQVAWLGKPFYTLMAAIRFLPRVCLHMWGQVAWIWKSSSTMLATIRSFSRVCSQMCGQVAWLGKSFPTLMAAIRFLPECVSKCVVKLLESENYFPHSWQKYVFFSQSVFSDVWSSGSTSKIFFHIPGSNSFFPECIRLCVVKVLACENTFPHCWQQYVFFHRVWSHVCHQGVCMGNTFSTLLTTITFFSKVCSHMCGQVAWLGKSFSTLLAAIRFLPTVCSHMVGQVARIWKRFSTLLAAVWLFHRVCSKMCNQVVRLWKPFSTLLAEMSFFPWFERRCVVKVLAWENLILLFLHHKYFSSVLCGNIVVESLKHFSTGPQCFVWSDEVHIE